jgi:hypothetical protein
MCFMARSLLTAIVVTAAGSSILLPRLRGSVAELVEIEVA